MVDIVVVADAILKMDVIVNGSQDVFLGNVFRNQIVHVLADCVIKLLGILAVLVQKLLQHRREAMNVLNFSATVYFQ